MDTTTPIRLTIADRTDLVPAESTGIPMPNWVTLCPSISCLAVGLAGQLILKATDQLHDRDPAAYELTWSVLQSRAMESDEELEDAVDELEHIGFLTRDGADWTLRLDVPEGHTGPRTIDEYYAQMEG